MQCHFQINLHERQENELLSLLLNALEIRITEVYTGSNKRFSDDPLAISAL
jgi:hypothetical protein